MKFEISEYPQSLNGKLNFDKNGRCISFLGSTEFKGD